MLAALFWRSAAAVTDVLDAPPGPPVIQFPGYAPEPCLFAPEQVTEYPHFLELSKELWQQLGDWSRWQATGAAVDGSYAASGAVAPEEFYMDELSISSGWKAGGWTRWGLTDRSASMIRSAHLPTTPEKISRARESARLSSASSGRPLSSCLVTIRFLSHRKVRSSRSTFTLLQFLSNRERVSQEGEHR